MYSPDGALADFPQRDLPALKNKVSDKLGSLKNRLIGHGGWQNVRLRVQLSANR
jgi:hypothetical protein